MADEDTVEGVAEGAAPAGTTGAMDAQTSSEAGVGEGATKAGNIEQELAKLRKQVEDQQGIIDRTNSERDRAMGLVEKLATKSEPEPAEEAFDWTEAKAQFSKSFKKAVEDEDFETIAELQVQVMQAAEEGGYNRAKKEFGPLLEKIQKQLTAQAPELMQAKAKLESNGFNMEGLTEDQVILFAAKLPSKKTQPSRPAIPGSTTATSVTGDGGERRLTDEEVAMLESVPGVGKLRDGDKTWRTK